MEWEGGGVGWGREGGFFGRGKTTQPELANYSPRSGCTQIVPQKRKYLLLHAHGHCCMHPITSAFIDNILDTHTRWLLEIRRGGESDVARERSVFLVGMQAVSSLMGLHVRTAPLKRLQGLRHLVHFKKNHSPRPSPLAPSPRPSEDYECS